MQAGPLLFADQRVRLRVAAGALADVEMDVPVGDAQPVLVALAGKAVGLFPSLDEAVDSMSHVKNEFYANPDNKAVYDRCFAAYKDLFKSLDKVFDQY